MKKNLILTTFFTTVLLGSAGISYGAFSQHEPLREQLASLEITQDYGARLKAFGVVTKDTVALNWNNLRAWSAAVPQNLHNQVKAQLATHFTAAQPVVVPITSEPEPLTLTDMKARQEWDLAAQSAALEPAAASPSGARWAPEQNELNVEAVLVPRQVTVISSSQDGRIAKIPFGQGDIFKKGDTLVEYDCADLEAEAAIAGMEKDLTAKKTEGSDRLFKLDIISDVDRLGIQIEDKQAASKVKLYQARMDHCLIRAEFDGHVTNRLANPGEYTRTDRVLMEVASSEPLQVEFMVPSKWLRWLNTGAPVSININETEATYTAKVSRIYGEVDPVSQSIQMVALLDAYNDPLLPGMSGQAHLSISETEKAGVRGYLQAPPRP